MTQVPIDQALEIAIDALDIRFARELGYTIKLVAEGFVLDNQLALHVSPVLLRRTAPLAQVRGAYNAVYIVGDAVGDKTLTDRIQRDAHPRTPKGYSARANVDEAIIDQPFCHAPRGSVDVG